MSQSGSPRTIHDDFEAIERYVASTFTRFERVLVTQIPALEEPRVASPDLALHHLRLLVETLAGFAVGAAVGAVTRAGRQHLGGDLRDRIKLLVGRIARGGSLSVAVPDLLPPVRFPASPGRPLLDELGAQLQARLTRSIPETRVHVAAVHAEITRADPAQLPSFADLLRTLTNDDASALAFADQLTAGWQHYALTVGRTPRRSTSAEAMAAPEPWRAWTRRLHGPLARAPLTHDEVVSRGFLMQIT